MSQKPTSDRRQYVFNLSMAAIAGQVGCLTLIVVILALLIGLWLDNQFQTKPLFTLIALIGSVPVTLSLMFWVVRKATSKIVPTDAAETEPKQEEAERGKDE